MNKRAIAKEIASRNEAIRLACTEILERRAREMVELFLSKQGEFQSGMDGLKAEMEGSPDER